MAPGLIHPIIVWLAHQSCLSKLRRILSWWMHTLKSEYEVKWSLPISSSSTEVSSVANQSLNDPAITTLSSKVQWRQAVGKVANIYITTFLCK